MICLCSEKFIIGRSKIFLNYYQDLYVCKCGVELYVEHGCNLPHSYYKSIGSTYYICYVEYREELIIQTLPGLPYDGYVIPLKGEKYLLNFLLKKNNDVEKIRKMCNILK
jgi:hypothetical protein